jgi:LysR family glycine cleavage system transcriptional activator
MSRRLPPLNALRAFEAAARHLSFTKAAEELFVTQAAVSHQVKSLEEHLGMPLFRRFNRRLAMTDAAQSYYPRVTTLPCATPWMPSTRPPDALACTTTTPR